MDLLINDIIKRGDLEAFKEVIESDFSAKNFEMLCRHNRLDMINFMLDQGFDINSKYDDPLIFSVLNTRNIKLIELLLNKGLDVNVENWRQENPLHQISNYRIYKMILDRINPEFIERKCRSGNTPLYTAIFHENITICRLLLNSGANVNSINYKQYTPLNITINLEKVKFGIAKFRIAKPEIVNLEIVKLLLEYGADPYIKNEMGQDCFHGASKELLTILEEHYQLCGGKSVKSAK